MEGGATAFWWQVLICMVPMLLACQLITCRVVLGYQVRLPFACWKNQQNGRIHGRSTMKRKNSFSATAQSFIQVFNFKFKLERVL